jgi:ribosome-associated protein
MINNTQDLLLEKASNIFKGFSSENSLNLVMSCSFLGLQFKAENLKVFYPKKKSPLADYVIVMTATNTTQANAIADNILRFLKNQKINHRVEGLHNADWILIDIQDTLVHIFLPETRDLYNLDQLYATIEKINVPDEFYSQQIMSLETSSASKTTNYQDYF